MVMHSIEEWRQFLIREGVTSEKEITDVLYYVEKLNDNNVPVIFDFNHLAGLLGLNVEYLANVVNSPQNHWRSFNLKKRSGGFRVIDVPYPTLLFIQRWIYSNILVNIPVSPYCHGFRPKRSIITNASWHVKSRELVKFDLSDFFPSIGINRIIALFREIGYNYNVSFYLASLCTLKDCLPQGAPTSPCLSNLVARPLDYRLMKLAKKNHLHYTRYADDLTFSGESVRISLMNSIEKIITDEGFLVNHGKTRLYRRYCKRIVTGICVSDKLSVPREYKRKIKQEVFYIRKYGLLDHLEKIKSKQQRYCASLLGRICFWLQVEPNNTFANEAKKHILMLMRNGYANI